MTVNASFSLDRAVAEIRGIYAADPQQADKRIEAFLWAELNDVADAQKIDYAEDLIRALTNTGPESTVADSAREEIVARLFSLVLGKKVSKEDLSSNEALSKLAQSLNTIFNALNQLIGLINTTFLGQADGRQTIRQVIGYQLEAGHRMQSLEAYLDQIRKAFLAVQQAFSKTAQTVIEELMRELDPVRLKKLNGNGHLFEVSRKAEAFTLYEEQFEKCRKWFESGRFMRDFLREFEKNCQKITLD